MRLFLIFLSLFLIIFPTATAHTKVRLTEVQTLTLNRGQYTTGRRNAPVPQLRCIGGTAKGQYTPAVVQCYNRGFDGKDVQWECKANMPREYEFGKISVSCEGFDYPDDPYILAGSCGLEYELNQSPLGSAQYGKKTPSAPYENDGFHFNWEGIIYFIIICFVIYLVYLIFSGPREGNEGDRFRGRDDGWFPGGGGGGGPHPPGWRPPPPPPSYDQATKGAGTTTGTPAGGGGPGFWTGLGMGALGGYLYGNNGVGGGFRRRNYGPTQYERDTGFYDQPSSSSYRPSYDEPGPSNSRHESTSYGGTTRR